MSTTSEFKSPSGKLIRFFQRSRDGWKQKCEDAKYELKLLKRKHRRLQKRFDELAKRSTKKSATGC